MKPERISLMDLDNFYRNYKKDFCRVMGFFTAQLAAGFSEKAAFNNTLNHYFPDVKRDYYRYRHEAAIVLSLLFSDRLKMHTRCL